MTQSPVKLTFGIIALNAQPWLEYNLRALYPFAHQIIVVEGAVHAAATLARPDGHSVDGTLEMLRAFEAEQDEAGKLLIVTAADEGYADGFWPEKEEMSGAYAKRATGNWLWQVDSDEFYHPEDMQALIKSLESDPELSAVSFPYLEFFGGIDFLITGKWHIQDHPLFHRLFKWGPGYSYISHRPPRVLDDQGRDLHTLKWEKTPKHNGKPIYLHHYSYVLPKQAQEKAGYYSNVDWTDAFKDNQKWYQESYLRLKCPLFLGEKGWPILQWLERFHGQHPSAVQQLYADLQSGKLSEPRRPTEDIERLLHKPWYWLTTRLLRLAMPPYWAFRKVIRRPKQRV